MDHNFQRFIDDLRGSFEEIDQLNNTVDKSPKSPDHRPMTDLTRQEMDAKLAVNKAEVDARLANFDTSVKTGFAELRAEMARQSGDFRADLAKLHTEVHKSAADLIKWAIGLAVAIVGVTVGLMTYLNKQGEKSAPAQPAPIIITVPGVATAPAVATPQGPAAIPQGPATMPSQPAK